MQIRKHHLSAVQEANRERNQHENMHTDGGVWGVKEACPYQSKRNISPNWIITVKYKQKIYGACIFEVRNEAF